jgi:hypothetical protein
LAALLPPMPKQTLIPGAAPSRFCMRISKKSKSTAQTQRSLSETLFSPLLCALCVCAVRIFGCKTSPGPQYARMASQCLRSSKI